MRDGLGTYTEHCHLKENMIVKYEIKELKTFLLYPEYPISTCYTCYISKPVFIMTLLQSRTCL